MCQKEHTPLKITPHHSVTFVEKGYFLYYKLCSLSHFRTVQGCNKSEIIMMSKKKIMSYINPHFVRHSPFGLLPGS